MARNTKIFVVGDSTVCDYKKTSKLDEAYLPRYGYGAELYRFFDCGVDDLALSGRSSLSFISERNYALLFEEISRGDFLLIAFGHNDEKSDDKSRFTDPKKGICDLSDEPSFKRTLYEKYIEPARAAGAVPVLCTPIVRFDETGKYTGKKAHITERGDYAEAVRELGKEVGVEVVDMTRATRELYIREGSAAINFHAHATYEMSGGKRLPAAPDKTHLNLYGAAKIAYLFATELKKGGCPLKNHIKEGVKEPTYEEFFPLAVRADYIKPDYAPFDPSAHPELKVEGGWYKTAVGGKISEYTLTFEGGKFIVGGNAGGISAGDEFGAIFAQVDADKNFEVSANVKITPLNAGDGAAFGIMARDDIYLGGGAKTGNFIAAGELWGAGVNFSREQAELKIKDKGARTGESCSLKLIRAGQKIKTIVAAKDKSYEREYLDVKLNIIDGKYVYICLFSCGGIKAEFYDVGLKIHSLAGEA